ncbi:MAG TPA: hypothetical protein PKC23_06195 [Candidatus Desulfobacillus sp.]|nr:hypothetical protein [Candidatus Desulfobacillus sp.]
MNARRITFEEFAIDAPTEAGERLREAVRCHALFLLWHVENTPAGTWDAVAREGGQVPLDGYRLLHKLHKHRPKRNPTAEEVQTLLSLLRDPVTICPGEVFNNMLQDAALAIFSLGLRKL